MADPIVQGGQDRNIPVGTIAEAEAEGLDVTQYATCCKPNPVTGVVGCEWFHKCRVSAKGVSGPRNYGLEIMKGKVQGGALVRIATNCMWIADHAENFEKNGGAVKVIANEGEDFDQVMGIAINSATRQPTHQKDPQAIRRRQRVTTKVPPYPRPGENAALLTDVLRAESIEAEKERRSDEATAKAYGLEHTIAPIDKRDARGDGGRKASGGGGSKG